MRGERPPVILDAQSSDTHAASLIDGDGLTDLLVSSADDEWFLCENLGGAQFSAPAQVTTASATFLKIAAAADLNNDGLPEPIGFAGSSNQLEWSRNLGGLLFTSADRVLDYVVFASGAAPFDIDGDGDDDDLVFTSTPPA